MCDVAPTPVEPPRAFRRFLNETGSYRRIPCQNVGFRDHTGYQEPKFGEFSPVERRLIYVAKLFESGLYPVFQQGTVQHYPPDIEGHISRNRHRSKASVLDCFVWSWPSGEAEIYCPVLVYGNLIGLGRLSYRQGLSYLCSRRRRSPNTRNIAASPLESEGSGYFGGIFLNHVNSR